MTRFDSADRLFAVCLAALAGYVDAVGFLLTGGFFVSFMSGNTTRLGVGLGAMSNEAGIAARLIIMFVGGVTLGTLIGRRAGAWRRPALLFLIAVLVAAAASIGAGDRAGLAIALLALAMGMENTVLAEGEVRVGLTYMTGNLVRMGQGLGEAIAGGPAWGWLPHALLWASMMAGAWIGAVMFFRYGLICLWAAAIGALLLTGASLFQRVRPA